MNRNTFLKSILGSAIFGAIPSSALDSNDRIIEEILNYQDQSKGDMFGFRAEKIPKVRIGMIGMGNRGKTLLEMLQWLIEKERAEVVAISDMVPGNLDHAEAKLLSWGAASPKKYSKDKNDWKNLASRDDIDLLLITTPWELHTPMCIFGMEQGKHVASEVPIAYTLSDCWELIHTAERTRKHCIMLENCCYNEEELFVLNMIENGIFGDISHTEGAYLHDLRALMLSEDYYYDQWRLKHHMTRDGNFYTTHGLGPISFYLHIGRGDTYDHLTSMSSREFNLSAAAENKNSAYRDFKCGDTNTTLIKTKHGKSIMLQFDVHTGRPYSRINKVVGSKAVHDGYPGRLYIEPDELSAWGHNWLSNEDYKRMMEEHRHPLITKLQGISQNFKQGHGGMDFVMMYRLITCLNEGLPLDINLYDGVMWSAVTPLSELSVSDKSRSIPFPDFTNGKWEEIRQLEIMEV